MEDPTVVLEMLAAGVCQLSALYAKEGIEFSSLGQPEQEALHADVLSQLFHATGHGARIAPEWDDLTITMQAYGGVTSVGIDPGVVVSVEDRIGRLKTGRISWGVGEDTRSFCLTADISKSKSGASDSVRRVIKSEKEAGDESDKFCTVGDGLAYRSTLGQRLSLGSPPNAVPRKSCQCTLKY